MQQSGLERTRLCAMLNAMQLLKSTDHLYMQQRCPDMLLFGQFLAEGNLQTNLLENGFGEESVEARLGTEDLSQSEIPGVERSYFRDLYPSPSEILYNPVQYDLSWSGILHVCAFIYCTN